MTKIGLFLAACSFWILLGQARAAELEQDVFPTSQGDLKITFIGHGSLMFDFGGKAIYADPVSNLADYSRLPKADLILITHEHGDHLDPKAIGLLRTADTDLILTPIGAEKVAGGIVMKNGQTILKKGIKIEAVPAYNVVHMRSAGNPFHPKGQGNGYVLTFGNKRVYIAGDTENIPEMRELRNIDIAFLPMNLPYTMTPEMVAEAARSFHPKVLYPYHYGATDPSPLVELLKNDSEIEVRIRRMQ
jgi:L-ascorbate metabolism protein UlaG (beta-lactamase superfamily)